MKQLNWYQIFGKTHTIPDGRTVTPTDDIQIWLNCADIWDKTYTTLAEVLADTTTLFALINSPNAVDYMVRSTTWAVSVSVPKMTSNTTPSGVVSASTAPNANRPAWKAFNGVWAYGDDGWECFNRSSDHSDWIDYEFTEPFVINKFGYFITSNRNCTYRIQGSNDGNTYEDIKVFSDVRMVHANTTFEDIANTTAYKHIRTYFDNMPYTYNSLYYLVGSFNFYSTSITDNATAMSYIGLNNYCANTLLADSTWCNAICNSEYFESVLNVKAPKMTSNNTPSGECSASSVYSSTYPAWKAFDGNDSTHWSSTSADSTNAWIQYKFTDAVKVYLVKINVTSAGGSLCCKSVSIIASNDGETFVELLEKQTIANNTSISSHSFVISPLASYERYRLAEMGTYTTDVNLNTVQFYGRKDV